MQPKMFQPILFAVVSVTLLLGGCSDFDEMKSKRMLIQAENLIAQGDEYKAEQVLQTLVANYPGTQAGELSKKHLVRILKQREINEQKEFAKILDSYRQVLNGYKAMYAEYPKSISALDQSDYFFNTAYLDEITPEGYAVYLWLKSDGTGYRAWCLSAHKKRGFAMEALSNKLVPVDRDEILSKIKTHFQAIDWSRKLVMLQGK